MAIELSPLHAYASPGLENECDHASDMVTAIAFVAGVAPQTSPTM
jgi:hypothetical protein